MGKLPINEYLVEAFKRNKCKQVHQNVCKLAEELIRRCWQENVFIVFTDGLRTFEDQAAIYGKGRSSYIYKGKQYGNPKVKKVSNAEPGTSFHNYGLALDFVTCDGYGKNIDWNVGLICWSTRVEPGPSCVRSAALTPTNRLTVHTRRWLITGTVRLRFGCATARR